MRILDWQSLNDLSRQKALQRPKIAENQTASVRQILAAVRQNGDQALKEFTKEFDHCLLGNIAVSFGELHDALLTLDSATREAFDQAIANIETYHRAQLRETSSCELGQGHVIVRETRPIGRVGFYIPSGTAPLVSTLMMLAVPARLAACDDIVVCTPPDRFGKISPLLLAVIARFGITKVYRVGGAQAVAAMAYGTETISKVDKIFGPGNSWVTTAKILVSQDDEPTAIDMPAGPSELMVLMDAKSDPDFVAADLLSQAEHGADSQVILLSLDSTMIPRVHEAIDRLLPQLSRVDIIQRSLEHAVFIVVRDSLEAIDIINRYAPEHLSLQVEDVWKYIPLINNAGSIFCGAWTPEAAGDYASGANHVLPTGGWARSVSGLSIDSFQKTISVQTLSASALARLSPTIERLSAIEGLDAHGLSVQLRMKAIQRKPVENEVASV
jgi:histidinol dehydrogenase